MLLQHRINLAFLVLLIVLYKCSYSQSVALKDDGFRPIFPNGNGMVMMSSGKSWKPSRTNVYADYSNRKDSGARSFNQDINQSDIDSENAFVPKAIPIRRSDAVPIINRETLYERSSPYYTDNNESQDYFKYNEASDKKKSIEVDDEDFSTYMMITNVAKALSVIENTFTSEDQAQTESRAKIGKKYRKYMLPLLLAYKLKFFALIPLMMGGLVLLAGSTGFAGFFFALFAATMGLKVGGHN